MKNPDEDGALGLFGDVQETPPMITVTAVGVSHAWLVKALGLDSGKLFALHGDELGAPRDYHYREGTYFYTAAGVRAIVRRFGLATAVLDGAELRVEAPVPRHARTARWDLEDRS